MTLWCIKCGTSIRCFGNDLLASSVSGRVLILSWESYRILTRFLGLKLSKIEFLISGFYEDDDSTAQLVRNCKLMFLQKFEVVHPAPGNATGTLVNGILHHCRLSTVSFSNPEVLSDADDEFSALSSDQDYNGGISSGLYKASVHPGIVHRLDEGTSGLLVVAKVIPTSSF